MRIVAVICALISAAQTLLSAPFQNLGFDDPDTNKVVEVLTNGFGLFIRGRQEDFLPAWEISSSPPQELIGIDQFPQIGYGYATLFSDHGDFPPVEGQYSLDLFADGGSPWTLSQTGEIPSDAKIINFLSYNAHFSLTINGVAIALVYLPHLLTPAPVGLPGYTREINDVYGDISAFASKTVDLTLTTLVNPNSNIEPDAGIDSIQFISFPEGFAVNRFGKRLVLSWPVSSTNFVLQATGQFSSTNSWESVPCPPAAAGGYQIVSTNLTGTTRFFRLIAPTLTP